MNPAPESHARLASTLSPQAVKNSVGRLARDRLQPQRAWVIFRLHWWLLRNHLWIQLTQARLRTLLLLAIAAILWFSLAALTHSAFDLLTNLIMPGYLLTQFSQLLLGALAIALGSLLAFTAGLTCYLELFRAPDAAFWLCSPLPADRIFLLKYLRTLYPGFWMLSLLVLPVLWEWHTCLRAPWWSYGVLLVALAGLLVLAASFGCLVCLLLVWMVPGHSRRLFVLLATLLVLLTAWYLGTLVPRENLSEGLLRWMRQVIHRLQPLQWFLAPSRWWSSALTDAATGQLRSAVFATALLWSNALMLYLLTAWFAGRVYRPCYTIIAGLGDRRHQASLSRLVRGLVWPFPWPARSIRALLRKDLLTLARDPVQWGQLGVLASILAVYFWTVAQLGHETLPLFLRRILQLLNLAMVALTLATWASRFVYPLVAQEIRALWLLALAPIRRAHVLYAKWMFASLLGIGGALVVLLLSHWMLCLDATAALLHTTAAITLGLSLAGTSVGLAGLFVQPRELSPTQPLTSYGNTITLLLCIALALCVTGLAGFSLFLDFQNTPLTDDFSQPSAPASPQVRDWILGVSQLIAGFCISLVFLHLGQRRLQRLEC
ncbi:MAG: hypothetical protein RMJ19_11745 [Gemmatales bacterium]|nr:hypothetical protein [Gemmatales bacterium]MCS7161134.1 hypothetical protein [Gemmatales bacterium]MDW8176337.1 hypothetical protein [Gemmatales bacterium]